MSTSVKRLVAVLLGALGLVLGIGGGWFAAHLGGAGTATFETTVSGTQALVVPPAMLNRVAAPVTVSVHGSPGSTVWMGAARPSDATSAIGAAARREVTGLSVSDWTLHVKEAGSDKAATFARADVWHAQLTAPTTVSLTVEQRNAPETVVATVDKGSFTRLVVSYERKAWFVQAVVASLVGLFLLLAGILVWRFDLRSGRGQEGSHAALATSTASGADHPHSAAEGGE